MSELNKFEKESAIGIVTCNREDYLHNLINSIDRSVASRIYVMNNGTPFKENPKDVTIFQANRRPQPVGIGKNTLLREMIKDKFDYLFILEDDIVILDNSVFQDYILTAADSGLWAGQLCYGTHGGPGGGNVDNDGNPIKRATVQYDKHKVDMYRNSLAAFTLYHSATIRHLGFMDERYLNAAEHLDHFYVAWRKKLGSAYWWFPDVYNSFEKIKDQSPNHENSVIRTDPDFKNNFAYSWSLFKQKFGQFPHDVKDVDKDSIMDILYTVEKHYARKELL